LLICLAKVLKLDARGFGGETPMHSSVCKETGQRSMVSGWTWVHLLKITSIVY